MTKEQERFVVFNKEGGMFKSINDELEKFSGVISVLVGLTILIREIVTIVATTGYLVVVGIIMIPVTIVLTLIIVLPIMAILGLLRRLL